MSGFSFSLKSNKVTKNGKGKPNSLLQKKIQVKKNAFLGEEDTATDTKTSIDAFDSEQGAMLGTTAVSKEPVLVIEPINKSHTLPRKASEHTQQGTPDTTKEAASDLAEEKARKSLLTGELFSESGNKVIVGHEEDATAEVTQEDYDAVPVDQFGAALLRGMGWSGEPDTGPSARKAIQTRQQGAVLGIGAKAVEKELEKELFSKKNLSAPLVRRER